MKSPALDIVRQHALGIKDINPKDILTYETYNVRLLRDRFQQSNGLEKFTSAVDKVMIVFLLSFLYLFVALEEADYQMINGQDKFDIHSDEWSLSNIFN